MMNTSSSTLRRDRKRHHHTAGTNLNCTPEAELNRNKTERKDRSKETQKKKFKKQTTTKKKKDHPLQNQPRPHRWNKPNLGDLTI